ncbi:ATP-binding protein [uncultured Thiohalocapsa sp.]|uniref:ATP-binding protein n=1 Tax=uncultured Thiohalocapsa sp. TaxID=768990 RepID=UPI0025FAF9E3|nr:ATP-binding protein [uncultured Thiohalocapsa sp.]
MTAPALNKPAVAAESAAGASPDSAGATAVGVALAALLLLWRRALPQDDDCCRLLVEALGTAMPQPADAGAPTDSGLRRHIATGLTDLRAMDLPLARIADAEGHADDALLLLCILGSMERSHPACMAVAALQAPAREPRPTLHLCDALLQAALGLDRPDAARALKAPLAMGLVTTRGDLPLPLTPLGLAPRLWAVLCGGLPDWPGCAPPPAPGQLPAALSAALPAFAARLADGTLDAVLLRGGPGSGRTETAAALAQALGRNALCVPQDTWLEDAELRLGCALAGSMVVLRAAPGPGEALDLPPVTPPVPLVVLLGEQGTVADLRTAELAMPLPQPAERRDLWAALLGAQAPAAAGSDLAQTLANARLSAPAIRRTAAEAALGAAQADGPLGLAAVAAARRTLAAADLRRLAQPLPRQVAAEALVLPPPVAAGVEEVILRAQRRESLWADLGPTLAATPTPGVRALFVGESGTGKTLAASHVATRLGAPLFRVDLSAVMNKYIGESEKNLAELLDRAAAADVVLLFDEADGVFGRRTDGRDTGERYANMLTDFLLSRIETHPGIVLLTTNSRERIDPAFTRRLDVILEFPLPGFAERLALWQSHLGPRTPGDAVCRFLAGNCELSGGQIRNAVLTAAAHAPAAGAIPPPALYLGVQAEYRKLGRPEPAKLSRRASDPGASAGGSSTAAVDAGAGA